MQIYLADDDMDDCLLFRDGLKAVDANAELLCARDGQELLLRLSKVTIAPPPDLIFLDINMPRKNGKECLQEIRSNRIFDNVPVVMFSTSCFERDVAETLRQGANLFVTKEPFFDDEVACLQKILRIDWWSEGATAGKRAFLFC